LKIKTDLPHGQWLSPIPAYNTLKFLDDHKVVDLGLNRLAIEGEYRDYRKKAADNIRKGILRDHPLFASVRQQKCEGPRVYNLCLDPQERAELFDWARSFVRDNAYFQAIVQESEETQNHIFEKVKEAQDVWLLQSKLSTFMSCCKNIKNIIDE